MSYAIGEVASAGAFLLILFAVMYLLCKTALKAAAEKMVSSAFDKSLERYRSQLTRSTLAYELVIKKELACYESLSTLGEPHRADTGHQ